MASRTRQQQARQNHAQTDKGYEMYTYKQPLKENEIRLLRLLRGQGNDPLQANLQIFSFPGEHARVSEQKPSETEELEEPPEYEALSYYWGEKHDPESEYSINIIEDNDTFRMNIRPNLQSALRQLRYAGEYRWLWVDALCLNQMIKDDADKGNEKNVQIPRMHLIYNKAVCVCIWLGIADEYSDDAMDFVTHVSDLDAFDDHFRDVAKVQRLDNFARLLRRDWFGRRWIVQELAVARSAVLYCGTKECFGETLQVLLHSSHQTMLTSKKCFGSRRHMAFNLSILAMSDKWEPTA